MACNFSSRCGLSVCISRREVVRSTRVLKFHTSRVIDETNGMIHSVRNESDQVTLSLHVYCKHVNFTKRSQFDPNKRTEPPFIVKLA